MTPPGLSDDPRWDRPVSLISYSHHRHHQLTLACRVYEDLGVPVLRYASDRFGQDIDPADVLANHQMVAATTMHPELIQWSGARIAAALAEARYFIGMDGLEGMAGVERILERDSTITSGAAQIFEDLPTAVQGIILANGAKQLPVVVGLDVPRSLLALPGPHLYAWQSEWHHALVLLKETFGDVEAPEESSVDGLLQRLAEVESDVAAIRAQMIAASAVLRPVEREDTERD